jgi:hypothetical protein
MSQSKRMVALAIAVSDAKPLDYLSGALNGARDFSKWATALGYETRILTDEKKAVTLDRLRRELETMLKPSGAPVHRLALYFAGHGFIREAEEGLWLLSDWYSTMRGVAIEVLKRRLYRYNIDQIAIFADACRSLPSNIGVADLTADGVLGRGPREPASTPPIDKFNAAQDGAQAYMVPGPNPEDDRCLFSGVLLEGLWGARREAISKILPGKVTSRSLGAYLEAEVPKVAKRYNRVLVPSVQPNFPEGDDIYYDDGPHLTPPAFPDWPPPETPVAPSLVFGIVGDMTGRFSAGIANIMEFVAGTGASTTPAAPALLDQLRNQSRPTHYETGSGFAVEGMPVKAVWTTKDVFARPDGPGAWWQVGQFSGGLLDHPSPMLVEFVDGLFAAAVMMPNFIATILRDPRGVTALIYREIHMQREVASATENAIVEMEQGALRADRATDLAVELRQGKHFDPVRGVLSAYLYDSIGDAESIRRMARFYISEGQPIPYDIALLADLKGELHDGVLWAQVPAVAMREPRTEAERQFTWTYTATTEGKGVVGGLWPWMRQGWTFLDDPADDGSTLVLPGLVQLRDRLVPARFATLDPEGGQALAQRFGLAPQG